MMAEDARRDMRKPFLEINDFPGLGSPSALTGLAREGQASSGQPWKSPRALGPDGRPRDQNRIKFSKQQNTDDKKPGDIETANANGYPMGLIAPNTKADPGHIIKMYTPPQKDKDGNIIAPGTIAEYDEKTKTFGPAVPVAANHKTETFGPVAPIIEARLIE